MRNCFLKDVGEVIGREVTFAEWVDTSPDAQATPSPSSASLTQAQAKQSAVASLSSHTDPAWIAARQGFEVGKYVVEKLVEVSPERVYLIFSIGESVQLHQMCSYKNEFMKATISLQELMSNWTVTKAEPPKQMQVGQCRPASMGIDMIRW